MPYSSDITLATPAGMAASRFLQQAAFGGTDEDVMNLLSIGQVRWLRQQMDLPPSSPSALGWMMANGFSTCVPANATGLNRMIWARLCASRDALRQRVALALSELLVVSVKGLETQPFYKLALASYWDMLERNAFGNYRTLLQEMTLSAAMGGYLSLKGSQKEDPATGRAPDENFARELLQLFSIGLQELNGDGSLRLNSAGRPIETYTIEDVKGIARALTGWDLDGSGGNSPTLAVNPMVHVASRHSQSEKRFLGLTIPAGTSGPVSLNLVLDVVFRHPNVGPFIGRQLIQRLVKSNPSPAYVARVSLAFDRGLVSLQGTGATFGSGVRGDMKALIAAVLMDPEARAFDVAPATLDFMKQSASLGKLREPMLALVQWARVFRARSNSGTWAIEATADAATKLAQSPLYSPSVFNFFRPGYVPVGSPAAKAGMVAPEFQLINEVSVAGYLNFVRDLVDWGAGVEASKRDVQPDYSFEITLANDPLALARRVRTLLCSTAWLPDDSQKSIVKAIASIPASEPLRRVKTAVFMTMASPLYMTQL